MPKPKPAPAAADRHPSREVLARVLSGTAESDEVRLALLPHLAAQCGECRRTVEGLAALGREFGHWDVAEAIVEWREAPVLWRRIADLPYARQAAAVAADEDYFSWGLCRFLQLLSVEEAPARPARAAELASLAVRISGNLGETYDLTWVRGLRALCLACLGDARRRLGEMQGAADASIAARQLIELGVGSSAFAAEVLAMSGLLARDGHRLSEAVEQFEAAQALLAQPDAEDAADAHRIGAALAHEAWCRYHQGDPAAALVRLEEASRLVDGGRDAALAWEIGLGRVWAALSLGRTEEARDLAAAARATVGAGAAAAGLRQLLLRPEARIAAASGQAREAEAILLAAVAELLAGGRGVEAALALVDLVALPLETGDARRLPAVVADLIPDLILQGGGLAAGDILNLLALQRECLAHPMAAALEEPPGAPARGRAAGGPPAAEAAAARLTPEMLRELAVALERRRQPGLDWWSGWGMTYPDPGGEI